MDWSIGGSTVIAFVEQQIQRTLDSGQPRVEFRGCRDVEQPLGVCERSLGACDPLLNGCFAADERACDLANAEAAQDVQNQPYLRLFGELRMAAGKHHAKQAIVDRICCETFFDGRRQRPFTLKQLSQLRSEVPGCPLAPE